MARYNPLKRFFTPPKQYTQEFRHIMEALQNQLELLQNIGQVVQDIQEVQEHKIRSLTQEMYLLKYENKLLQDQLENQEKVKMESRDDEALDDGLERLKNNIQDVLKAMKDV